MPLRYATHGLCDGTQCPEIRRTDCIPVRISYGAETMWAAHFNKCVFLHLGCQPTDQPSDSTSGARVSSLLISFQFMGHGSDVNTGFDILTPTLETSAWLPWHADWRRKSHSNVRRFLWFAAAEEWIKVKVMKTQHAGNFWKLINKQMSVFPRKMPLKFNECGNQTYCSSFWEIYNVQCSKSAWTS